MYEENSKAAFAFLITALSIGISIPALVGDDITNYTVAISVFALGKFVFCLDEMIKTNNVLQTIMYFVGAILGAIGIMLCFVVFAREKNVENSKLIACVLFGISAYYMFIDGVQWSIGLVKYCIFKQNIRKKMEKC